MAKTFRLEIVSPERTLFEADNVVSVVLPGVEGEFGVMANHRPMMAALKPGVLKLRDETGKERFIAISGGFAEVANNRMIVLANTAELAENIDVDRAREALRRAQERLGNLQDRSIDRERARLAKERAMARLRAAGVRF